MRLQLPAALAVFFARALAPVLASEFVTSTLAVDRPEGVSAPPWPAHCQVCDLYSMYGNCYNEHKVVFGKCYSLAGTHVNHKMSSYRVQFGCCVFFYSEDCDVSILCIRGGSPASPRSRCRRPADCIRVPPQVEQRMFYADRRSDMHLTGHHDNSAGSFLCSNTCRGTYAHARMLSVAMQRCRPGQATIAISKP